MAFDLLELPSSPVLEFVELTDCAGAELSSVLATEVRDTSFEFPYPRLRATSDFVIAWDFDTVIGVRALPLFQSLPGPWRMKSIKSFVSRDDTVGSRACSLDLGRTGTMSSGLDETVLGSGIVAFRDSACPSFDAGRDISFGARSVRDPFADLAMSALGFDSCSGPVDRMKSAKSIVVSFSILASRAAACAGRPLPGLRGGCACKAGPVEEKICADGDFGSLRLGVGFDRSPFIPLSEALERPVAGLPWSVLDWDVFRERLEEASASDL